MIYLLKLPLEFVAMFVAYLTNWFVVLFADEKGDLPKCLYWWQTYDNCLDVDWMIYEHCVPKFAEYDFNKHYIYHLEEKPKDGTVIPGYVDIIDPNFTLKEKFQRYICRVCWLYRNSNYGFSYYVNGVTIKSVDDLVILKDIDEFNNEQFFCYDKSKNILIRPWSLFYCKKYCKWFRFRLYIGWKLKGKKVGRHMLAISMNPFKPLEQPKVTEM